MTNPVSLAFFAGFFLAHPDRAAVPLAGAAVFCMAATWFGLLGLVLGRAVLPGAPHRAGRLARLVLAALLVACAALAVRRALQA